MAIKVNMSDQEAKSGDGTGYLPSGNYHCVITSVESADSQSDANPGKPLLKFVGTVQDGEFAERELKWTACCWDGALYTIVGLLKALDEFENCGGNSGEGLAIPDAEEFYVQRHVMVRRGLNKKAKEKNPEDDPMTWIEVRGFSPYREGQVSGKPSPGAGVKAGAGASILP
jgi:hypothetical protein